MKYRPTFIFVDDNVRQGDFFVRLQLSALVPQTIKLQCNYLMYCMLSEPATVLLKINFHTLIYFEVVFVLLIINEFFEAHRYCILNMYPVVRDCFVRPS
jgi:hypothetical protein